MIFAKIKDWKLGFAEKEGTKLAKNNEKTKTGETRPKNKIRDSEQR